MILNATHRLFLNIEYEFKDVPTRLDGANVIKYELPNTYTYDYRIGIFKI